MKKSDVLQFFNPYLIVIVHIDSKDLQFLLEIIRVLLPLFLVSLFGRDFEIYRTSCKRQVSPDLRLQNYGEVTWSCLGTSICSTPNITFVDVFCSWHFLEVTSHPVFLLPRETELRMCPYFRGDYYGSVSSMEMCPIIVWQNTLHSFLFRRTFLKDNLV